MVSTRQPNRYRGRVTVPAGTVRAGSGTGLAAPHHLNYLANEAQALLTRLEQVRPFETSMPMVMAASIGGTAQKALHDLIRNGRTQLRKRVQDYILMLRQQPNMPMNKAQSAFSVLKLQFNALLDQFDIFADVLNQRSEHETGVWLAGLDVVAKDVLRISGQYYRQPPMVCYLDRGHGAAIRRARTRLPGGKENPVAVIKVPRERMVGSGIGSSLVHEVGHQGAALLGLIPSLRPILEAKGKADTVHAAAWKLYGQWISEILSDFWAVATLGISATTGLMGVVSLPSYFVFRMPDEDPHPYPWIRVKISIAFGRALYPDPQWDRLERTWEAMYPAQGQPALQVALIKVLQSALPAFVRTVLAHKPSSLKGRALGTVFPLATRTPAQLRQLYQQWQSAPQSRYKARPGMVFAVIGQARADGLLSPAAENRFLSGMLYQWAVMQQQSIT